MSEVPPNRAGRAAQSCRSTRRGLPRSAGDSARRTCLARLDGWGNQRYSARCDAARREVRNRAPGLALAQKSVLPRLEALAEPWSAQAVSLAACALGRRCTSVLRAPGIVAVSSSARRTRRGARPSIAAFTRGSTAWHKTGTSTRFTRRDRPTPDCPVETLHFRWRLEIDVHQRHGRLARRPDLHVDAHSRLPR